MTSESDGKFHFKGLYEELEKIIVPENPSWKENRNYPSTSEMVEEICKDISNCFTDQRNNKEKVNKLKLNFILHSNCGEDEGTQTMEATVISLNKKRDDKLTQEEQVTVNLMNAIDFLEERNLGKDEDKSLLDVEECILDAHQVLMRNLMDTKKCGRFSTKMRLSSDGHIYPKFETEEEAYDAVQEKVDRYNHTIDYINDYLKKPDSNSIAGNLMYFKCAAWILYHFVALHPFSDGNGRMCRLLASRCLNRIFPFPCPIYNIYAPTSREEYIKAIKKAKSEKIEDLDDLVALLIESGWHAAKCFKTHLQ